MRSRRPTHARICSYSRYHSAACKCSARFHHPAARCNNTGKPLGGAPNRFARFEYLDKWILLNVKKLSIIERCIKQSVATYRESPNKFIFPPVMSCSNEFDKSGIKNELEDAASTNLEADMCSWQTRCWECWQSFLRVLMAAILTGWAKRSTTADYQTHHGANRRGSGRAKEIRAALKHGPAPLTKRRYLPPRHCGGTEPGPSRSYK